MNELKRVKILTDAIQNKVDYIQRLKESTDIGSIEYDRDRIQKSPEPDPIGKIASMIVDEENELKQLKNELIQARIEALKLINTIDDARCEKVLYLTCIKLLNIKDCADVMNYSYSHTYSLYRKGLKIIDDNK